jgi:hypothetical protein
VSTNKLVMGIRDAAGWRVLDQVNMQLRSDTDYNLLVAVNGLTVTLMVNNSRVFTRTFAPRVDADGFAYGLNSGMVAIGANNARGRFDNVAVQVLPPQITYAATHDFAGGVNELFLGPTTGHWQLEQASGSEWRYEGAPADPAKFATSLATLPGGLTNLRVSSYLELAGTLRAGAPGGFVFDYYGPDDFKYVTISATGQIVIGHRRGSRWTIDASVNKPLEAGRDHVLSLALRGTGVSLAINGVPVLGYVFNGVVLDGRFGVLAYGGVVSFDSISIRTDDPGVELAALAASADGLGAMVAAYPIAQADDQAAAAEETPASAAPATVVKTSPFALSGSITGSVAPSLPPAASASASAFASARPIRSELELVLAGAPEDLF